MLFGYSPVMASEPLLFNYTPNPIEQKLIDQVTKPLEESTFEVSAIDLNKDGIDEFVLKSKECKRTQTNAQNYCHYLIVSNLDDEKMMTLGEFHAKSLILSNNFFKGIRELHVYNVKENDYDYNIARWNTEASGYEIINNGY